MNENHFQAFVTPPGDRPAQGQVGRVPRHWAGHVLGAGAVPANLPAHRLSRAEVQAFCDNDRSCDEQCFLTIMAWGGMNVRHGQSAWNVREGWLPIVRAMRASNLSRRQAYVCFRRFRRANRRCGLGPAFFTKLIFFLNRRERGYFMDQWTGLGINLLFEPAIVDLNVVGGDRPAHVVSDGNCGGHYERFCQAIECLARRTGWPAELVEERLFCKGGQGPGPWRQYVIDHRPNGAIRVP